MDLWTTRPVLLYFVFPTGSKVCIVKKVKKKKKEGNCMKKKLNKRIKLVFEGYKLINIHFVVIAI